MSVMMNNYERKLVGKLQVTLSKREAEETLRDIRECMYGNPYTQIRAEHYVQPDGTEIDMYPDIEELIKEYYEGTLNEETY